MDPTQPTERPIDPTATRAMPRGPGGPGGPGRPTPGGGGFDRRWLYGLAGLAAILVAVIIVLLVTDNNNKKKPSTTTTTTTTSASTSTTTTTVPPTTTTTVAPTTTTAIAATCPQTQLPNITQNDPQSYAQYFFATWNNNDKQSAENVANQQAISQMFSAPCQAIAGANPYAFQMCDPAAGSTYCTWKTSIGAQIVVQVRNATGGLPVQVVGVQRS